MKRKYLAIIIASIVLLGSIFLMHKPLLLAIGNFLVIQDNLQPADVIHVIAAPDYRTDYAIQLYKKGFGRKIFFTGGWCRIFKYLHGRHAKERALRQGVPGEVIAIDDSHIYNSYEEVVRLKEFVSQSKVPIHSVIVVTDPHNTRRARWIYRMVLGDKISLEMAPVPFGLSPYKSRWWQNEKSRQFVRDEYLKFVYYYARYRLSWRPVKKWMASLDRD
jgi:uncharacterized SAM-binding protein YcdF (DUF218 family)